MPRYLVMVDFPHGQIGAPIAGVYCFADSKPEAAGQVRALLADAKLTVYIDRPDGPKPYA